MGIDRRPWPDADQGIEMYNVDIRKRAAEEVFRRLLPDVVIHMATVTYFTSHTEERYQINLKGTQAVFAYCHKYGIKQAIFVGRHTCYGTSAYSPIYQTESAPPAAVNTFPEFSDLVAADLFAASAMWRYPELQTAILRICYTLGPSHHGTLANYLKGPYVPTVWGFDPLFQFIHEMDAVRAIILTIEKKLKGIFNVSGPSPVPLSVLICGTGRHQIHLPSWLFPQLMGHFGLPNLPPGAVSHIKYPVVVSSQLFRNTTGFKEKFDEIQTMESFRYV
jgi:UDP-glucose 4-epimerase